MFIIAMYNLQILIIVQRYTSLFKETLIAKYTRLQTT